MMHVMRIRDQFVTRNKINGSSLSVVCGFCNYFSILTINYKIINNRYYLICSNNDIYYIWKLIN